MPGSILITGANGTLGLAAVQYLLTHYPTHTALLTVRNPSPSDPNTKKLLTLLAAHPLAKAHLLPLDLASLASVAAFSQRVQANITAGTWPRLDALICNAMTWSLNSGVRVSTDGLELAMAVNTLAHFDLVVRLLGVFDEKVGRVVFLGSEAHAAGKAGFEVYPPVLPEDLDALVHCERDKEGEEAGRGFQRYGLSKLVGIMLVYELNRRLRMDPALCNIRALAVDPGGLLDSRAFSQPDVPLLWKFVISAGNLLQPLAKRFNPKMNCSRDAARDVVDAALSSEFSGKEGHFLMREEAESSVESQDEKMQARLWEKSVEWCKLEKGDSVLEL